MVGFMYPTCFCKSVNTNIKFQELHCFECHGNPDAYIDRGDRYCQKVYNCQPGR